MRLKLLAVAVALATTLAGCTFDTGPIEIFSNSYGARTDSGYRLPAIPVTKVPAKFRRQTVRYDTPEAPGTIIVDTQARQLYLVLDNKKAIRYGCAVGRDAVAAQPASESDARARTAKTGR